MEMKEFVQSLRNAADFFESHPELGVPYPSKIEYTYAGEFGDFKFHVDSRAGLAFFARTVGGHIDKEENDTFYKLISRQDGFSIRALAYRENICERVQVATKFQEEQFIPAREAETIPAQEVPVYEWRCPSLLKDGE